MSHIPTYGSVTKTAGTQTDTDNDKSQESIKRVPRWRRHHKHRRSASMSGESSGNSGASTGGMDNFGYIKTPPMGHSTSLDNLLNGEGAEKKKNFLMKYRQVSGDLRGSQELVDEVDEEKAHFLRTRSQSVNYHPGAKTSSSSRDRSIIESKTVRKEKRKNRFRDTSGERQSSGLTPALRRFKIERAGGAYTNTAMDTSDERDEDNEVFIPAARVPHGASISSRAPLASQECDLSPVGPHLSRSSYNASYRLATNHAMPRTSTKLRLDSMVSEARRMSEMGPRDDRKHTAPLPPPAVEPVYTVAGPGPIRRFAAPAAQHPHVSQTLPSRNRHVTRVAQPPMSSVGHVAPLTRNNLARASVYSTATQDSGLYSQVSSQVPRSPSPTAMFKLLTLLLPPSYRRKLQLLLKFVMKISMNQNLKLDSAVSNKALALETFLEVILRPSNISRHNRELSSNIVQYFLDHYEQVLTPPQDLRREVEEEVYRGLVTRRLEAGEDPYPVTYCEQVTRNQYEENRLTGSQAALKDLLEAILRDEKMERKNKKRKLKKFKEAYPDMWR